MIYLSSDLHFGHDREFLWGPRGFNSIEENDNTILKNFKEILKDEDDVCDAIQDTALSIYKNIQNLLAFS